MQALRGLSAKHSSSTPLRSALNAIPGQHWVRGTVAQGFGVSIGCSGAGAYPLPFHMHSTPCLYTSCCRYIMVNLFPAWHGDCRQVPRASLTALTPHPNPHLRLCFCAYPADDPSPSSMNESMIHVAMRKKPNPNDYRIACPKCSTQWVLVLTSPPATNPPVTPISNFVIGPSCLNLTHNL